MKRKLLHVHRTNILFARTFETSVLHLTLPLYYTYYANFDSLYSELLYPFIITAYECRNQYCISGRTLEKYTKA